MSKLVVGAACGAAIGALMVSPSGAGESPSITSTSVAGAKLGLGAGAYKRLFGSPSLMEPAPGGNVYTRLVFPKRKVSVYFWDGVDRGIEIITWNRSDRSALGIGPCSPIAQLKTAYGSKVAPMPSSVINGAVYTYQSRNVLFAANGKPPHPARRVTAVGVFAAPLFHDSKAANYAGFFTLRTPNC